MKANSFEKVFRAIFIFVFVVGTASMPGKNVTAQVAGSDVLYTTDADFDKGTLVSVNHDSPNNNQLQLDSQIKPFPFINVAASGRGTVVRSNTDTGAIVGEYWTAPEGRGLNPSRTTVDLFGNVWTANREEVGEIDGVPHGSAVKIGLIVGGTRVNADGSPNPDGGYLAPPFDYNTCADRDGDNLIRTSKGLGDILHWTDVTDGMGGVDGLVQDAEDECILVYQRLYDAEQARHVSVDADNNVWVGGYPFVQRMFYKLDSATGAILDSFDTRDIGCGGYGGLVDGNGILWSVGGALLRYDPVARTGKCIQQYGYGLGIDTNGYIWMSLWDGGIVKIAPDGTVVPGFPKPTFPSAMTTMMSSFVASDMNGMTVMPNEAVTPHPLPADLEPEPFQTTSVDSPTQPSLQFQAENSTMSLTESGSATFQVAPVDEWVQSSSPWTPGATISLTVEEGGSVVYTDSQTADGSGNFHFGLWDVFDLKRGQVVIVSDGTNTKTHTVANLFVDGVNIVADTVFGHTDANAAVDVWVHGNGWTPATADGSGYWTADFSGLTDLTYLSDGGSSQTDNNGDSTGVWWASPQFGVAPVDEWVQSSRPWKPGTTITLTIEDGGMVVYSDSQVTDTDGNFNFNFGGVFDLKRGQLVTVSDGTNIKTHTVVDLFVDGVNVTAETVYGHTDASANVDVWVHGDGGLNVTVDGSGNWTADFSGMTDLTYLSDGGSSQKDDDGDSTGVWWASPRIQVAPVDDWVQSVRPWTPGATITLTVEEGGVVVHSDSQTANADGNFNFNLWDVFDLKRGQVVTVSDGTTIKTHTVMPLYVDRVDLITETVFGRAGAGTAIDVWVHGDGNLNVTADPSGNWTADFSSMTDITYANDGGSQQTDSDGDSTGVWWAYPGFRVSPDDDWINSRRGWKPDATITLTIEDGGVVVYSDLQAADSHGNFRFDLWDVFDIQRGQVVTVSDGTTTKTHTVANLYVDSVNVEDDDVFGRADAGTDVDIYANDSDLLTFTADGSGNWVADFSGITDLTYLSNGASRQVDDDGDATRIDWSSPRIQVAPDDNWVSSWSRWTPGSTVTLTIKEGGVTKYSDSQVVDTNGYFNFNLWNVFDLERGQEVTVSDGTNIKIHTVMPLYVDVVDVDADTISGRGKPNTDVEVWVHGDGNMHVTADPSGKWTADFSGQTDLTYINDGGSQQMDEDGDSTGVWWASPRFWVAPDDNWVQSNTRWTPGATITLTIAESGVVKYTDSQISDSQGNFNFNLWSVFDLQRGQVVTVSDGKTTKTHTVMPFYVDGVNVTDDTIFGRADADTEVDVWVHGDGNLLVTADEFGDWTADFTSQTDLTYLNDGGSAQYDEDGDGTGVWWSSPNIQVSPDENWVQQWNRWTPGATVTLKVEDSSGIVFTDSQTADTNGNFSFNIWGVDLDTGHIVTVSDGTTTKTHTVTDVNVTDIDMGADLIRGSANPGARVRLWVYDFSNGSERTVTADGAGNWEADFPTGANGQPAFNITDTTFVNVNEFDDDGDSTYRRVGAFVQGSTGVAVTHIDNNVWVANRNSGTVTRLDNDGNVLKMIPTGQIPTGVAVDAAGKVWATNLGSDNVVRIDPNAGSDGLGEVDLTVDLGPGANPYNYSDMTGTVVVGSTSPQGIWTVIQDSGTPGFEWGCITWNQEPQGSEPPGTEIVVEARAADTEAGLGGQTFQPVLNGELFSMPGRYIEVRVTLKASPEGVSPVLSDIRIQPSNRPPTITSLVAPAVPGQINQAINATVTFEDPDPGDAHTATWNWGDGSTTTQAAILSSNSASHTYTAPGVYTLSVTITDAAGASDTETFQYVVIYDPNGGFVTGGGWITSPLGAYTPEPSLTGKATFGFVSKYQKGANIPTGNTEFQFHVANMNFKSSSYDWLVIAGTKAQYKGTGTINGMGEYKFMLTAIDGSPDKFRIKIWDKATGDVIYDNQLGASDTADPTTAIQGGSIVVHKAK